jgi:peptide/nickel transport system substrate-binding protein
MYNTALVMSRAAARRSASTPNCVVVDWPTSVLQRSQKETKGWNVFYTGWGTQPALGALATMTFFRWPSRTRSTSPRTTRRIRPDMAAFNEIMNGRFDPAGAPGGIRKGMQRIVLEQVYGDPVRLADQGAGRAGQCGRAYKPFRIPRFSNVWLTVIGAGDRQA